MYERRLGSAAGLMAGCGSCRVRMLDGNGRRAFQHAELCRMRGPAHGGPRGHAWFDAVPWVHCACMVWRR